MLERSLDTLSDVMTLRGWVRGKRDPSLTRIERILVQCRLWSAGRSSAKEKAEGSLFWQSDALPVVFEIPSKDK